MGEGTQVPGLNRFNLLGSWSRGSSAPVREGAIPAALVFLEP